MPRAFWHESSPFTAFLPHAQNASSTPMIERREAQRLVLAKPVPATFGEDGVLEALRKIAR